MQGPLDGFAIDLGGTKTAAARVEGGRMAARLQDATRSDAPLSDQIEVLAAMLADLGYHRGDPLGAAVAGRVDGQGIWRAVNADTLSALGDAPLTAALRDRFGAGVALNDAAAAALAEARLGAGQGVENFAYLTVSTGVGGGLVMGGRLLQSADGLAGHVGFMSSGLGRGACGSGRVGTVESVASGRAMAAAAGLADARAVFDRPECAPIIARSAAAVAALCADLRAILGIERIAIGGSIGLRPDYFAQVSQVLSQEPALFRPEIRPAALGQDSGLLGAVLYARETR